MKIPRLTIARIMGLVLISALGFLAARTWLPSWQRPARPKMGDSQLYESAPPSDDLAIQVGPNVFKVGSVVRNDRDGSLRFEDGRGKALSSRPTPEMALPLVTSAPWLDAANIQLEGDPSRIEVFELRVFDHATRKIIGNGPLAEGASEIAPGIFQICRIGGTLPDEVDVWFRATSHPKGDQTFRLPARAGASASFAMGIISISEIRQGRAAYTLMEPPGSDRPVIRWSESDRGMTDRSAVVLDWTGGDFRAKCQIAAVGRDGSKRVSRNPETFDLWSKRHVIEFPFDPDQIDHFEFRLSQTIRTFYFEGVRLPPAGGLPFSSPPAITVAIDGGPKRARIAALGPLRVELETRGGERGTIREIDLFGFGLSDDDHPRPAGSFDALLRVDGLASSGWKLTFLGADGRLLDFRRGRPNIFSASGNSAYRGAWGYDSPLEQVRSIVVSPPTR